MSDTSNRAASLFDLRPSDPAIAARWAELFPYMVETWAATFRKGMAPEDEEVEAPRREQLDRSVGEFANMVWAAPAQSFGDVLIRAALARFMAIEDTRGGQIHEVTEDEYPLSFERSAGHVVLGVLRLAGLPIDGKWQEILAGTVPLAQRGGDWTTRSMTAFDLESEINNVQAAFGLVEYFSQRAGEGEAIDPEHLGQAVSLLRMRITELDDRIMGEESTRRSRERERAAA